VSITFSPSRAVVLASLIVAAPAPAAAAWAVEPELPARQGAASAQAERPLPRTSLPMVLVGVMRDSRDPSRSACLVRCASPAGRGAASFLEAGATACDLAEIREIREDGVTLRNLSADSLEFLPLPHAAPRPVDPVQPAAIPPEPVVAEESPGVVNVGVPKASVEHYLVNLGELMSAAQAAPRIQNGAIDGFEIRQIRAGSIVEQLGLRGGDVIVEVNGEKLDGLPTVMRLVGQAQSARQATLTVLRGGQRMTFVLNVK
jgi:type II secretory pathway component PulC